jgi:hypothetical protein
MYVVTESGEHDATKSYMQHQAELLRAKYLEHGSQPSAAAFSTSITIYWNFHNPGTAGIAGECILNQISGDFLDLGNKNWMFVGTASGTQYYKGQRPITLTTSLEYTPTNSSLKWSIGNMSHVYDQISETSPGIQYKSDVNGSPQVIIVRVQLAFQGHYMHPGSYSTFKSV